MMLSCSHRKQLKLLFRKKKDYFRFKNSGLIDWSLLKWPQNFQRISQNELPGRRIVYTVLPARIVDERLVEPNQKVMIALIL